MSRYTKGGQPDRTVDTVIYYPHELMQQHAKVCVSGETRCGNDITTAWLMDHFFLRTKPPLQVLHEPIAPSERLKKFLMFFFALSLEVLNWSTGRLKGAQGGIMCTCIKIRLRIRVVSMHVREGGESITRHNQTIVQNLAVLFRRENWRRGTRSDSLGIV